LRLWTSALADGETNSHSARCASTVPLYLGDPAPSLTALTTKLGPFKELIFKVRLESRDLRPAASRVVAGCDERLLCSRSVYHADSAEACPDIPRQSSTRFDLTVTWIGAGSDENLGQLRRKHLAGAKWVFPLLRAISRASRSLVESRLSTCFRSSARLDYRLL
jgi:hypothetical protein